MTVLIISPQGLSYQVWHPISYWVWHSSIVCLQLVPYNYSLGIVVSLKQGSLNY